MMAEPQKFFVGLVDLFSVWLPGALLAYLLKGDVQPCLAQLGYVVTDDVERWVVFLFISYVLGHFVFLLGSLTLDPLYDALKSALQAATSRTGRWWWEKIFNKDMRSAQAQVDKLQGKHLRFLTGQTGIGTFQWAKARLALVHPDALAIVHRFEADSKFFRSLAVVMVLLIPWALATCRTILAGVFLVMLAGALWRFAEQRAKTTIQAYWFIIALEGKSPVTSETAVTRP